MAAGAGQVSNKPAVRFDLPRVASNNLSLPRTQGSASSIATFQGNLATTAKGAGQSSMPGMEATKPAASNVRRVGTKTFYRKGDRWVDAEVKPEDDAKAVVVEQFGAEFFRLAEKQTAEQNQYFAFNEPVTVRIADRVYKIDPPPTPQP